MRKLYISAIALFAAMVVNAQSTTLDLSSVNSTFTKTVDDALVIDAATAVAAVASPALSFENPLMGKTFTKATISFDVKNYGEIKVLGSLMSFYNSTATAPVGRMYLSNGMYLGFNVGETTWFDANMINYGIGTDFLGTNAWKNVKLVFSTTGYAVYVDDVLAFNQSSTDVTISSGTSMTDYSIVTSFLQVAPLFIIGTGSWWSDNKDDSGAYYDLQNSYLKNITFTYENESGNELISEGNSKVVSEDYFNITGASVGNDFNSLGRGIYIKRVSFDNGSIKCTKILKRQ